MDVNETAQEKLEKIANTSHLLIAIERLEQRRRDQEADLKARFHEILDSLRPRNILKNTLHEVQESTPLKHNLLKIAVGLGAGYLSRKVLVRESAGVLKKALGTALQYGVTNFVASRKEDGSTNNVGKVGTFVRNIFRKKKDRTVDV